MAAAKSESSSRSSANDPKKRRRWLRFGLLALVAALTLVAVNIARYPSSHMNPNPAEFAIVLGARSLDRGPLPVFQARIEYAIRLYREGKVKKILFTGGANVPEKISQAEVAKRYAMERGVPESDILLEELSMRTLENFREAVKVLPNPGNTSVLIISDPLHLKRAMLMAKDAGLNAEAAPVPQTVIRSRWNRGKFLVRETFGYIYYWLFRR